MQSYHLDKETISTYVFEYVYASTQHPYRSRCSEGNYKNSESLPILALPGGDAGELAILYATANVYGFELDLKKAYKVLLTLIGGKKSFSTHSGFTKCGYLKHLIENPQAYSLDTEQVEDIKKNAASLGTISDTSFDSFHNPPAAVIQVKGEKGLYPQFTIQAEERKITSSVFVVQQTFIDRRHRALAKQLIEQKAVKLYNGLDDEYFY